MLVASWCSLNIEESFAAARRLQQGGQLTAAEAGYRRILDVAPDQAEVHYNLGIVLRDLGRFSEAAMSYAQALKAQPRFPQAANNLGVMLERMSRMDEAEHWLREAGRMDPASAEVWNNLGGVLKDLARFDEAVECYDRAIALQPGNPRLDSNRIFALHYGPADDPAVLLGAAQEWGRRFADPLAVAVRDGERPSGRRLRIGYLSAYFREHCQALFTVPLLAHHDHAAFEIFCYSDVTAPDAFTGRLRAGADVWRDTARLGDAEVAALIRSDQIDVLVDLTIHMAHDRLLVFARKPAPVQVTWLGYPGTSGLKAMDWRLTDAWLDPTAAADACYVERSHRLDGSFWCYDPLTDQPPVNPLPALAGGPFTFGCLNNYCKVTDLTLELWTQVLQAVPGSRLLMLAPRGSARERVRERLGVAAGLVDFAAYQPRAAYLELYHQIDLGLDTFPYNGHTTSLDSLWMGVPVVSRTGRTAVSRAGLSLLANLGLGELATPSPAEFVRIATTLAGDPGRLAALRGGLRGRMEKSPLMNAARFTRNLEQAYREMWSARTPDVSPPRP